MSDLPVGGGYLFPPTEPSLSLPAANRVDGNSITDGEWPDIHSVSTELDLDTIAFRGQSLKFQDRDNNIIMEISNGKVKIFGDLEIEKATNRDGENDTEALKFNSESSQFFERSIDDTLNKLKNIIDGTW